MFRPVVVFQSTGGLLVSTTVVGSAGAAEGLAEGEAEEAGTR
jgi:hypothetical protein